jgi:DNA-binding PadR family transcriptional regulator
MAQAKTVTSAVPRGFSRYYLLHLLRERPMTGKELMEEAAGRSEGRWHPSPGLVYPLLGRLLAEGLIEEGAAGRYRLTKAGQAALEQYGQAQAQWSRQFEMIASLGLAGKFLAQDIADRVMGLGSSLKDSLDKLTAQQLDRYRAFLADELARVERRLKKAVS